MTKLNSKQINFPLINTEFDEIILDTTTTSISFIDLLEIDITTGTNNLLVFSNICSDNTSNNINYFRILLDGYAVRGVGNYVGNGKPNTSSISLKIPITLGNHNIKLQWKVSGGTGRIRPVSSPDFGYASLLIQEITV